MRGTADVSVYNLPGGGPAEALTCLFILSSPQYESKLCGRLAAGLSICVINITHTVLLHPYRPSSDPSVYALQPDFQRLLPVALGYLLRLSHSWSVSMVL